jgi:hypothetical protein
MRTTKKVSQPAAKNSAKKKNAERVPNIKELLLDGPRFSVPKRTKGRPRPPVIFD